MSHEIIQQKINTVQKRLYGVNSSAIMLKRYKRCITFDEKTELFLVKAITPYSDVSKRKLFDYIHFWIKQCPEFRIVRKSKFTIKKTGKLYTASCDMQITLW